MILKSLILLFDERDQSVTKKGGELMAEIFIQCKILLSQQDKSVEIKIYNNLLVRNTEMKIIEKVEKELLYFKDGFTLVGSFESFPEGNIPLERKVWIFTQSKWELVLKDCGGNGVGQVGGGLEYGEMVSTLPDAVLNNAGITTTGFQPIGAQKGSGMINNGSAFPGLPPGPVTWELTASMMPGNNMLKEA